MKKECKTCGYELNGSCRFDGKCHDYSVWYAKEQTERVKLDEGKIFAGILQQWPLALIAVLEVATFGVQKYPPRGSWQYAENGVERYTDAMFRHLLKEPLEETDQESGLSHDAHVAWNALSRLELRLRQQTCEIF